MDQGYVDALNQAIRLLSLRHRARAAQLIAPLGLYAGQEALLLELDRTGPRIQAQLSEALGCEPPSVTLMTRKLEASGHIQRTPSPADRRATIVALTDSGRVLVDQIKQVWVILAEETVRDLPAEVLERLPGILQIMSNNVNGKSPA
jgi:DNA-binding MarR family transcriptional regulator